MSTEIVPFSYKDSDVRATEIDGEVWVVAKDVCDVLEIRNTADALKNLDGDEKSTIAINDGTPGNPTHTCVNEAGLYSLILRSRKPEAKAFKRWITHEVLPAIRKSGTYEVEKHVTPKPISEKPESLKLAQYSERAYRRRAKELSARGLYENPKTGEILPLPTGPTTIYSLTAEAEQIIRDQTKKTIRKLDKGYE